MRTQFGQTLENFQVRFIQFGQTLENFQVRFIFTSIVKQKALRLDSIYNIENLDLEIGVSGV